MKDTEQRYAVAGTSALKPDCSRYSNENERIIDFPGTWDHQQAPVDYNRISQARHVRTRDRLSAQCHSVARKSEMLNDLERGSLKGTPFGSTEPWKIAVIGGVYSLLAIAALFIAV
jgi:hypothetical protein